MKILVVDDQPQAADSLAQHLRATGHAAHAATSGQQALEIARAEGAPDVLITEVVMEGMDGFALRESLRATRPDLSTIYLTGYDLSAYQEYTNGSPVIHKPADPRLVIDALPKPPSPRIVQPLVAMQAPTARSIAESRRQTPPGQGERKRKASSMVLPSTMRSQSARIRTLVEKQGFSGRLDQFELMDIVQMCCQSARTGRLEIARGHERGVIFLLNGEIVHAIAGEREGEDAVYQIIGWANGQFNFDDGLRADTRTVGSNWQSLLMESARRRDESQSAAGAVEAAAPAGDLVGQKIGPYDLVRKIGSDDVGDVFEAVQTSMDRTVALKVLGAGAGDHPAAVQEFLAIASIRANVQHPSILSVYEAGQSEGRYYYAREYVDGLTMADLHAQGRTVDDIAALRIIRVVAEAISYLNLNKFAHQPLAPRSVYLGKDGRPRLNNTAALTDERAQGTQAEIRALAHLVADCLPGEKAATPGVRALLGRMVLDGSSGFLSWGALLQGVKALEPKVAPKDASVLNEQERAALETIRESKKRQKMAMIWSTIGLFSLVWIVIGVAYLKFRAPAAKDFDKEMVAIPAGDFIFQEGQTATIEKPFWIDKYEITIGQYAEFLVALKQDPELAKKVDHPDAAGKKHEDTHWDLFYKAALAGSRYNGAPLDLNCPVFFVDWFDAYAYAKWRGHRLPTEQEWEKAARGTDGRRFPWGNDPKAISKVNTSADFHEDATQKGEFDGYNRWSPVDAMTGDRSPYGVMDMAGNVAEWTATLADKEHPVIRGGTFGSKNYDALMRNTSLFREQTSERVGFRTVADAPPPKG